MKRKIGIAIILMIGGVSFTQAEEAKKPWANTTEFSLVSTNGNSQAQSLAGKETFVYNWTRTSLELEGGGFGANSKGEVTAEKYFGGEKFIVKLTDRNYAFEKYNWDKDRFAKILDRHNINGGLGREMMKTPHHNWLAELGGGYIAEDRIGQPNVTFGTGRAYTKYTWGFSESGALFQDVEYLANFKQSADFRVNTETSLVGQLSSHLSLKLSFYWKHVGVPPINTVRNDTTTTVGLVAKY